MRNLKFRSAYAENILCFGSEGINLHFSDYGNVIQIRGVNLDNPGTKEDPASNAAGKSSVQEILSIGLFGKTVKNPTKLKGHKMINRLAKKAEVVVEWDDYRVMRTFKVTNTGSVTGKIRAWQSKDHIWDDESEITKGGKPCVTQDWIDERLGLNHHAFCNIVIFDDANVYSFLKSDTPTKREFVENLLGLDQYRKYHENAKALLKERKKSIEVLAREYSLLLDETEAAQRRIQLLEQQQATWKQTKQSAFMELASRIKAKQGLLEKTDSGQQLANWQKSQDRITHLTAEIVDLEGKSKGIQGALGPAREKLESTRSHKDALTSVIQGHTLAIRTAQAELNKHVALITKLDGLEDGAKCPTCYGTIKKDSYGVVIQHCHTGSNEQKSQIHKEQAAIDLHKLELDKKAKSVAMMESKIGEVEGKIALYEGKIRTYRKEISELAAIRRPEGNAQEQVLEAEITELKKQAKTIKEELDGASPYTEILASSIKEAEDKKARSETKSAEIKKAEDEVPYYQFWVEAFGDRGIRRYVVDGIIPALNSRIAYWLSHLIDSKIELKFDNELEETITRSGNPADFCGMSKGEVQRVNLAVSHAFAYVMMLNSGCCPNIVFLDEVTGGGIDRPGVVGVYNMIFELAKERQVFVTTHDENLKAMLQGCETLTLQKQDDVTVLVS